MTGEVSKMQYFESILKNHACTLVEAVFVIYIVFIVSKYEYW